MGDRRTEVNHPASGITTFTYDAIGNVLTKQTANACQRKASPSPTTTIITGFDGINYPDHPENNVVLLRRTATPRRTASVA